MIWHESWVSSEPCSFSQDTWLDVEVQNRRVSWLGSLMFLWLSFSAKYLHSTSQHHCCSVESRGSSCYTGPIPTRSTWSPSTASISEWRERAAFTARGSTSRTSLARVPVAICGSNWVNRAAVVLRINTVHGRSWIVREGIPQMRIAFAHVLAQSLRAG